MEMSDLSCRAESLSIPLQELCYRFSKAREAGAKDVGIAPKSGPAPADDMMTLATKGGIHACLFKELTAFIENLLADARPDFCILARPGREDRPVKTLPMPCVDAATAWKARFVTYLSGRPCPACCQCGERSYL
ncbi:hypothetical protein [Maricaulis sp.]|uniref:hypothetical protein n=1 Tax=Maricaulis sp. TaxID=1486257 RepID=UPI001B2BD5F7|nr:hypothetical protein [Maricaulis sp.]MBO6763847.1 hypothetical protein [Maricaulis sp.]